MLPRFRGPARSLEQKTFKQKCFYMCFCLHSFNISFNMCFYMCFYMCFLHIEPRTASKMAPWQHVCLSRGPSNEEKNAHIAPEWLQHGGHYTGSSWRNLLYNLFHKNLFIQSYISFTKICLYFL